MLSYAFLVSCAPWQIRRPWPAKIQLRSVRQRPRRKPPAPTGISRACRRMTSFFQSHLSHAATLIGITTATIISNPLTAWIIRKRSLALHNHFLLRSMIAVPFAPMHADRRAFDYGENAENLRRGCVFKVGAQYFDKSSVVGTVLPIPAVWSFIELIQ